MQTSCHICLKADSRAVGDVKHTHLFVLITDTGDV
jgi:hypothetical protein